MAFPVRAEGCAPGGGNACLPQQPGAEGMAVHSKGLYIRKCVKGAARRAAGHAGNPIEGRNHPVPSLQESVPHPVHVILGSGHRCQGRPLCKRGGTGIGVDHQQLDTFCEFGVHDPVSDPPACHGVGLGESVQDYGAVLKTRDRSDGKRLLPVYQPVIDFIRQNHNIGSVL